MQPSERLISSRVNSTDFEGKLNKTLNNKQHSEKYCLRMDDWISVLIIKLLNNNHNNNNNNKLVNGQCPIAMIIEQARV
ncbi:hypothetical protein T07_323 [Trichinella nelsoni]|uniref:Uncharacterized protein n=1 Tax=Trichinella nelsoni TaxID=6336 RepID=A0A0V0S9P0_9BILA|nr:hypothetical protein T07_323 [Trichinella nelsoni]